MVRITKRSNRRKGKAGTRKSGVRKHTPRKVSTKVNKKRLTGKRKTKRGKKMSGKRKTLCGGVDDGRARPEEVGLGSEVGESSKKKKVLEEILDKNGVSKGKKFEILQPYQGTYTVDGVVKDVSDIFFIDHTVLKEEWEKGGEAREVKTLNMALIDDEVKGVKDTSNFRPYNEIKDSTRRYTKIVEYLWLELINIKELTASDGVQDSTRDIINKFIEERRRVLNGRGSKLGDYEFGPITGMGPKKDKPVKDVTWECSLGTFEEFKAKMKKLFLLPTIMDDKTIDDILESLESLESLDQTNNFYTTILKSEAVDDEAEKLQNKVENAINELTLDTDKEPHKIYADIAKAFEMQATSGFMLSKDPGGDVTIEALRNTVLNSNEDIVILSECGFGGTPPDDADAVVFKKIQAKVMDQKKIYYVNHGENKKDGKKNYLIKRVFC